MRDCNYCQKQFCTVSALKRHLTIHTGEKPFQCHVCSKRCSLKSGLMQHISTHTLEKSHTCEVCSKTFSRKFILLRHIKTHSGERPHKCELCSKCFADKNLLNKHKLTHTGEKPYECQVCGRQFADKSALNRHVRIHTGEKPYHCDICGKQFIQKSSLNKHLPVHAGDKPHKCSLCGKKFTDINSIKNHMLTHNGKKWYECELCNETFSERALFNTHLKIHKDIFYNKTNEAEKAKQCPGDIGDEQLKSVLSEHIPNLLGSELSELCDEKISVTALFNTHLDTNENLFHNKTTAETEKAKQDPVNIDTELINSASSENLTNLFCPELSDLCDEKISIRALFNTQLETHEDHFPVNIEQDPVNIDTEHSINSASSENVPNLLCSELPTSLINIKIEDSIEWIDVWN